MQEFRRTREFSRVITRHKVSGPKVSVHYIVPARDFKRRRVDFRTIISSMPVVIAMAIGVGLGSLIVWQSKFGAATPDQPDVTQDVSGDNLPWVKLIEFNQSDLNIIDTILPELIEANRHEPTAEEIYNEARKEKLRQYFKSRKSPFADNDETLQAFLDSKNMKMMIAISFVESTMGKKCYYYNCSGIGGYPPDLRKYENFAGWIRDFDSLLEKRYKNLEVEDFIGLYVQPGSANWVNGVKQILGELKQIGIE